MKPQLFTLAHDGWQAYLAHLDGSGMMQHALDAGLPKADTTYIGIYKEDIVIGHISIKRQALVVPASYLTDDKPLSLYRNEHQLYETFVQTFAVEESHRRQGHGRALQEAALEQTQAMGCCQMRSWSSADKYANYGLKLSMGFGVYPALYPIPGGKPISGVYFVMQVE